MYGKIILKLRKEKGLRQRDLAEVLNIGKSTVAMYELEKRTPDLDTVSSLAQYFDVTVDYLLGVTNNRGTKEIPLSDEKGIPAVQRSLKNAGLLDESGNLSERSGEVISDFLSSNTKVLRKLIAQDD